MAHTKDCSIHGCEGYNGPRYCDCGAAPAETAAAFCDDMIANLKHNVKKQREARETAGEMTAEQFYEEEFGRAWDSNKSKIVDALEAFAKQRVEQAERDIFKSSEVVERELVAEMEGRLDERSRYIKLQADALAAKDAKVADLERERDTLRSVAEENDRDYNVVCDKLAAAESELREMREALASLAFHIRQYQNGSIPSPVLEEQLKIAELLARKAGS